MIEPEDVVALLKLCDAVDALAAAPLDPLRGQAVLEAWKSMHGTGAADPQCPIPRRIARELITVWLRVAAKHEQIAIQRDRFRPEVQELVEVMLFGEAALVTPVELAAAARMVAQKANECDGHPFIVCHCGEEFLPGQPHCPACGELVQ